MKSLPELRFSSLIRPVGAVLRYGRRMMGTVLLAAAGAASSAWAD